MKISEVVGESRVDTEAEQLTAVKRNGHDIFAIRNPSEAVQLAAVNQNGYALQHIKDPSTAVMLTAIRNDPNAIEFVKSVDPEVATDPIAKKAIIFALLKFMKEATDDVDPDTTVRKVATRFLEVLRRSGCDWPELKLIQKGVDSLPHDS